MKFSLHPGAAADLDEAASYYQKQAGSVLSQALLLEFERAIAKLQQYSMLGAKWRYGTRRFVMERFPYSIVYLISGDELQVVAIAHHSRGPGYWRGRKTRSEG